MLRYPQPSVKKFAVSKREWTPQIPLYFIPMQQDENDRCQSMDQELISAAVVPYAGASAEPTSDRVKRCFPAADSGMASTSRTSMRIGCPGQSALIWRIDS